MAYDKRRLDVFQKYLPELAEFYTRLAGKSKVPNINPLLKAVTRYQEEESSEEES